MSKRRKRNRSSVAQGKADRPPPAAAAESSPSTDRHPPQKHLSALLISVALFVAWVLFLLYVALFV